MYSFPFTPVESPLFFVVPDKGGKIKLPGLDSRRFSFGLAEGL